MSAVDHTTVGESAAGGAEFERLVDAYYGPIYHFALSLTHDEAEASDMTQEVFCIWAAKGHQLRDGSKARTWLFTTLHREFLKTRHRERLGPHCDLDELGMELPAAEPAVADRIDGARVLNALAHLPEVFRAPLALFYVGEHSYREIAEILEIPIGTVQSRIARGKAQLQETLMIGTRAAQTRRDHRPTVDRARLSERRTGRCHERVSGSR